MSTRGSESLRRIAKLTDIVLRAGNPARAAGTKPGDLTNNDGAARFNTRGTFARSETAPRADSPSLGAVPVSVGQSPQISRLERAPADFERPDAFDFNNIENGEEDAASLLPDISTHFSNRSPLPLIVRDLDDRVGEAGDAVDGLNAVSIASGATEHSGETYPAAHKAAKPDVEVLPALTSTVWSDAVPIVNPRTQRDDRPKAISATPKRTIAIIVTLLIIVGGALLTVLF